MMIAMFAIWVPSRTAEVSQLAIQPVVEEYRMIDLPHLPPNCHHPEYLAIMSRLIAFFYS